MTEKEIDNNGEENKMTLDENQDNSPEDAKAKRHAEQMAWSKAEVERLEAIALEAQKKLAEVDANNLLELYSTNPQMAEKVAKRFWYDSFAEAKAKITGGSTVQVKTEDDFDVRYQAKRAEERHQEAIEDATSFIEKSKLEEAKQQEAKTYFDRITNGKQLTRAEAIEYADMATLYVQKERIKEWKYQEWLKEMQSSWLSLNSKKTSVKSDEPLTIVRNGELIVLPSNKSK